MVACSQIVVVLHRRIVQVMAKSYYQKKKKKRVHFCISCIQTLVMHMTVELCSIRGTMFSGICVHVSLVSVKQ